MHPDWARSLRDQCQQAGVPFLFKQWGAHRWVAGSRYDEQTGNWVDHGITPQRVGKKLAGRELDGRTWDQYPPPCRSGLPA
jgi:protein gp37